MNASPGFLPALLSVLLLASGTRAAGEDLAVDWSFIGEGQAVSGSPYGPKGVPLLIQSKTAMVTDSSTTPPNPFPDCERSLFIDQDPESPTSRIRIRPFQDETPASGSFEVNFRVAEGRFRLDTGFISVPWDPANDWAYIPTDVFFGVTLTADEAIQCKSATGLRTDSVPTLSASENYKFRIEWTTEGDNVVFLFHLNGEPVITREGQPFSQTVPKAKFGDQSLSLSINVGSKEEPRVRVFLGRISASAGTP